MDKLWANQSPSGEPGEPGGSGAEEEGAGEEGAGEEGAGEEGAGDGAAETWTIHLNSHEHTVALGRAIGRRADGGDVFALMGQLGTGKTTLAQGIMEGLGVEGRVTSPTFTLMQRYEGRLQAHHIDAYRLDSPGALYDLGIDVFPDGRVILVVEWADRVLPELPPDRLEIQLEYGADPRAGRRAVMRARGDRSRHLLRELKNTHTPGAGEG